MSKSNDTTKTRELTEAELAAVSGGFNLEECMISGWSVVAGGGGFIEIGTTERLDMNMVGSSRRV